MPPVSAFLEPVSRDHRDHRERRWQLIRDLAVFQAKLVVDGVKDLVLAPVSLVAALVGMLVHRSDPGRPFYALLRWGHGFDRWVNLFGAGQPALPPASSEADPRVLASTTAPTASPEHEAAVSGGLDAYASRLERVLIEQYRRGGLTAKAKDAIDEVIDGLQDRGRRPPPR
jgi:hypothetical protein